MNEKIVLASTSPYRQQLLMRLGLKFQAMKPTFDEDTEKKSYWGPVALAQRLAYLKAASLVGSAPTIIGGDQLVSFQGQILGKPGHIEAATETLRRLRGQTHELVTAVCVMHENRPYAFVDITELTMKSLSDQQIANYLKEDQPFDCAGSYKIETRGLFLFDKIQSQDFTAIQGLPLVQTGRILEEIGYKIF